MSNLIKIIKYSVKIKLNFFKDIMNKLCEIFQSPYKPSQASILFHTTFLRLSEFFEPCDCGQISENIFFYLNLLMQKIFFNKIHWFELLSTKNKTGSSYCSYSQSQYIVYLSVIPSCLLSVGKKQPLNFNEKFIASPHQVT